MSPPPLDRWTRRCGLAVFTLLGFVLGAYSVMFSPLYWEGWPIILTPVVAAITNPLLAKAACWVTGRPGAGVAPAVAWCAPWLVAMRPTIEGDALLASQNAIGVNWVGLVTFLVGPTAFGIVIYRSLLGQARAAASTGRGEPSQGPGPAGGR